MNSGTKKMMGMALWCCSCVMSCCGGYMMGQSRGDMQRSDMQRGSMEKQSWFPTSSEWNATHEERHEPAVSQWTIGTPTTAKLSQSERGAEWVSQLAGWKESVASAWDRSTSWKEGTSPKHAAKAEWLTSVGWIQPQVEWTSPGTWIRPEGIAWNRNWGQVA